MGIRIAPMRKLRLVCHSIAVNPRRVATVRVINPRIPEKYVMTIIRKIRIMNDILV